MSNTAATAETSPSRGDVIERSRARDRRALFLSAFFIAALFYIQFEFWKQPSEADRANWDYISQVIARGGVPYRDVVNIKTPLSGYIGAAAIIAARPFGLRDVFAIRIVYLLLGALVVAFTSLIAFDYFKSHATAAIAGAIMLAFTVFSFSTSSGVQPKTPMILFGLVTLWAINKDKPFLAGLFGMMSALCWQPGLLFVAVAALAFSRYLTSWRDMKAFRVLAGAIVPLAVCLAYFSIMGALSDFYRWNIEFNYSVYGPREARTIESFTNRFMRMLAGAFRGERAYFALAAIGAVVFLWREARQAKSNGLRRIRDGASHHSIIIAPAIYFAFCTINIQGGADMIPLLPFVAIFAAVSIDFLIDKATELLARLRRGFDRVMLQRASAAFAALLILALNMRSARAEKVSFPTLQDQDAEVAEIRSHLEPGDKIFVQGAAQILVLSNLPNASRHYFLDRGKDSYLDVVEPGGFAGWLERLRAERIKVVALDRMKTLDYKEEFFKWVEQDYDERKGRIFTYYVRKETSDEQK